MKPLFFFLFPAIHKFTIWERNPDMGTHSKDQHTNRHSSKNKYQQPNICLGEKTSELARYLVDNFDLNVVMDVLFKHDFGFFTTCQQNRPKRWTLKVTGHPHGNRYTFGYNRQNSTKQVCNARSGPPRPTFRCQADYPTLMYT